MCSNHIFFATFFQFQVNYTQREINRKKHTDFEKCVIFATTDRSNALFQNLKKNLYFPFTLLPKR